MSRIILLLIALMLNNIAFEQIPILVSNVNSWKSSNESKTAFGTTRTLFDGSGKILSRHTLKGITVHGGKKINYHDEADELFFIIKSDNVEAQLNGQIKLLAKGSVVFVLPGDKVTFKNPNKDDVAIYEMRLHADVSDFDRGKNAGPSFMMDWYDMVYKPHDRGGVRQLFDRKTVMMNRFDIHITSLNPGISSHPPHTHQNEEIILMIDGEGEMILGDKKQKIITGDAAWVESMIPHNITNIASRPAVYFAIQWN